MWNMKQKQRALGILRVLVQRDPRDSLLETPTAQPRLLRAHQGRSTGHSQNPWVLGPVLLPMGCGNLAKVLLPL